MERLSYETLKNSGHAGFYLENAPEKVMQFGKGNFLRAFADYWFDLANQHAGWNGKCCIIQSFPSAGGDAINAQQGLYTVCLRGIRDGRPIRESRVISSVSRCLDPFTQEGFQAMMDLAASDDLQIILSNTTEAGIVFDPGCRLTDRPCSSFPGKLTQVLYRRWQAGKPGVILLPCELIDSNGPALRSCVEQYIRLWQLEAEFLRYVREDCRFCSTLVDRIVSGAIRDPAALKEAQTAWGYTDPLADQCEPFGLWVIEGDEALDRRLSFRRAGLAGQVAVVPDVAPYKKRKVRILNGAHTGFVPGAFLAGFSLVREAMEDPTVTAFLDKMLHHEILPVLDMADAAAFADSVLDRFRNPDLDHRLLDICLNSTAKFRARNLPTLLEYVRCRGQLPPCLTVGLALYIALYSCGIKDLTEAGLECRRPDGTAYLCRDDRWVLEFYCQRRSAAPADLVREVLGNTRMWGQDLRQVPGLEEAVTRILETVRRDGPMAAFAGCL